MATTTQLPGVYFRAEAPRPPDTLPRMDIAAFVGFASSGPLHVPVAVEDIGRFRDLFGDDLELAWDPRQGAPAAAQLAPAVEAFFRNGGLRCWVVRVADETAAATFTYDLPGLRQAADPSQPGVVEARSPGAWIRPLSIGTVLEEDRILPRPGGLREFQPGAYQIDLQASPRDLRAGDLLQFRFDSGRLVLNLFVTTADVQDRGLRVAGSDGFWFERIVSSPSSPDNSGDPFEEGGGLQPVAEADGLDLYHSLPVGSPSDGQMSIWRLTFQIIAWRGGSIERRLSRLAFHSDHPRFWGNLPADADLFANTEGRAGIIRPVEHEALRQEASEPRFPVAAPAQTPSMFLPVGMSLRPDPELAASENENPAQTDLELNGLAVFDPALFLDGDLAGENFGSLLNEANHKFYIRQDALRGIHSLLPVSEVSMIAVPDASAPGWTRTPPELPEPLAAPVLDVIPDADPYGRYILTWTSVHEATGYILQRDFTPEFTKGAVIYEGETAEAPITLPPGCRQNVFFRVRARRYSELSPWSNSRGRRLPPSQFEVCSQPPPGIADLQLNDPIPASPPGTFMLVWTTDPAGPQGAPDRFEVQQSADSSFSFPVTIYIGAQAGTVIETPPDGVTYYRVRARAGRYVGDWSNTVRLAPTLLADWTFLPVTEYDLPGDAGQPSPRETLLAVQRALMRFCAARADAVAILGAPLHYRRADVTEHLNDLLPQARVSSSSLSAFSATGVPPLTLGEDAILSYAAFYHPWIAASRGKELGVERSSLTTLAPPEGAICGMTAALTIRSGAWYAPANLPLTGVLALDPVFPYDDWAQLTGAQINVLLQDPTGFLTLNSQTLSDDSDFRELNVRRLMILLRRLALREGPAYVFEPNDPDFRDRVRDRFERILGDMFVRGAFAGRTAEQGYQVVADDSVNTVQTIERGQFIVELRVAPSKPLGFLTVRLVQSGPEQLEAQEV